MKHVRLVVALLSLPSLFVVATASRAATPSCRHLITDPRGDAYSWFLPTQPYNPDADLLSVDAVTTPATIDFTITVARIDPKPTIGTGVTVYFATNRQGAAADYSVSANHVMDGTAFSMQNDDTNQVAVISGAVDLAAATYVIHVPRAKIQATYNGGLLKRLGVITAQIVGVRLANGGFIEQSTGPLYHYRVGDNSGCSSRDAHSARRTG